MAPRNLSPSILVALGIASACKGQGHVGPCLDVPATTTPTKTGGDGGGTKDTEAPPSGGDDTEAPPDTDAGPCLEMMPCLKMAPPDEDPEAAPQQGASLRVEPRSEVTASVLDRGVLPEDVAETLRLRRSES